MLEHSIVDLCGRVRSGAVTSTEFVKEALKRASANANLNAFITLDSDGALKRAARVDQTIASGGHAGALAGVPIVVKDNLDVQGLRTTAGTPGIEYVPASSASAVSRLERAGAIVIGKTNMHELAFGVTSSNRTFGAVRNPVDPTRFPGGSSGGTAAAVAAGIAVAGLGTDTAGSVRVPAALCGVVGLRPTTWRVPQDGAVPAVPTFDVIGPMARNMSDVALLNSVMTHDSVPAPRDTNELRIGVAHPESENTSEGVASAFEDACSRLREGGTTIVEVDLSEVVTACFEVGYPIAFYEMKYRMVAFLEEHQPRTTLNSVVERIADDEVKAVYMQSVIGKEAPTQESYVEARARIDGIRANYLRVLDEHALDAVAWPTVPLEAQPIDGTEQCVILNGKAMPTTPTYIRNAASAGVLGAPGITLPIGTTPDGLPVGFEVDGRPDGDSDLVAVALGIEAVLATSN